MIYTLTFNPAIDYIVHTERISIGATNRTLGEEIQFGGKGINVSLVLKELGIPSKALGFIAGFTGEAIEREIKSRGIATDFIRLEEGFSRINIKIKSDEETEINARGPRISESALNELSKKLEMLENGDTLVLAGSIPSSLPSDIYEKILEQLSGKQIRVVVDATNELLLKVLKYKPFLIKPNKQELAEIFDTQIDGVDEIIKYAKKLREMGALNVLVSMAGEGAVLLDENGESHVCKACKGTVINSVGAGDSMVAGFLSATDGVTKSERDYEFALKLGSAAGGATVFSSGLARAEDIFELLKQLN